MKTMVSSQFKRRVIQNVRYWHHKTTTLSDSTLSQLDRERLNLYRAVHYGLHLEETALETAELVVQLFDLPERRGYWGEWISILKKAIAAIEAQDTDQQVLKIKLLNQLGFLHRLNRNLDAAISLHLEAIDQAEHVDSQELSNAYFYLGNAYYDKRQYELARHVGQKALEVVSESGWTPANKREAAVFNLLGLIAHAQGHYKKAKQLYRQSITGWQGTDETTYLARTWNNLGLSSLELMEYVEALQCFSQASDLLATTASILDKVKSELFQGVVFFQQKEWTLAKEAFQSANKPFLWQSGDLYHQALLMNNLGNVYLMLQNFDSAEACLGQSIALWRKLNDELMLGNTIGALADVQKERKQIKEALATYEDAIEQLAKFPQDAWAVKRAQELRLSYNDLKSRLSASLGKRG